MGASGSLSGSRAGGSGGARRPGGHEARPRLEDDGGRAVRRAVQSGFGAGQSTSFAASGGQFTFSELHVSRFIGRLLDQMK